MALYKLIGLFLVNTIGGNTASFKLLLQCQLLQVLACVITYDFIVSATFMYSCLIYGRMNILMLVYPSSSKTILFVECTSALPWECLLQVMDALLYPYLVIQTIGFVWLLFLTPVIDTLAMLLVGDSFSFTIQACHMC